MANMVIDSLTLALLVACFSAFFAIIFIYLIETIRIKLGSMFSKEHNGIQQAKAMTTETKAIISTTLASSLVFIGLNPIVAFVTISAINVFLISKLKGKWRKKPNRQNLEK